MMQDEDEIHEEGGVWEIALADLMTTLMVFFLIMWLVAMIDPDKRVEFVASINGDSDHIGNNLLIEDKIASPKKEVAVISEKSTDSISNEIKNELKGLFNDNAYHLSATEDEIKLTLMSDETFRSGKAFLNKKAKTALHQVARQILTKYVGFINDIEIVGHTDDVPIKTIQFPSNWELSSARAASVARLFVKSGIPGEIITIEGRSNFSPILEKNSSYAKKLNRRVEIFLKTKK